MIKGIYIELLDIGIDTSESDSDHIMTDQPTPGMGGRGWQPKAVRPGDSSKYSKPTNGSIIDMVTEAFYSTFICITRFNKIAIQDKGPDDKLARKPLAY